MFVGATTVIAEADWAAKGALGEVTARRAPAPDCTGEGGEWKAARGNSVFSEFEAGIKSHVFVLFQPHAFLLQQMSALLAVNFFKETLHASKVTQPRAA